MEPELLTKPRMLDILLDVARGQALDSGMEHPVDLAAHMAQALFAAADTLQVLRRMELVRWDQ